MTGKQLFGGTGAIRREPTKADLRRMLAAERDGNTRREFKRIDALVAALKQFGSHSPKCKAYAVIGRFGSRTGLLWNEALDAKTCDCGLGAAISGAEPPQEHQP